MHFQNNPKPQAKLLYCIKGRGIDYAVDLRRDSPTFLKWVCVELSEENRKQIFIPKGFGHVFISLEDNTKNVMRIDESFDSHKQA
ncbi:dTDP-4-dehydrorhamnose 3,5-epimerase family protein [Inconstantimicrobium porci]|uniref:dTDP-4-dehydrorhamnose 3,5-epimerase family protein n=1 Tax=Inconstantimicrobium porci TaxID=2652291 RepID=UPI00240A48CB|nr:dTDP-4-dehydrorhamnose 3,5-epimerase [Inconstantimicrobium porci]MDD6771669.1 dTDP-4-dehydrorhamnose 3,5-epimerase [Inconstantimicrobium porci]